MKKSGRAREPKRLDEVELGGFRRRVSRPGLLLLVLGGAFACVATWSPPVLRNYHRIAPVPDATELVGADECEDCHDEVAGYALGPDYHADCERCHGPGELHVETEELADIRFPSSADCSDCHATGRGTHLAWSTSEHERTGVMCSDCHQAHSREPMLLRAGGPVPGATLRHISDSTRLCVSCHAEVASRLNLPSHHPVQEGMLDCVDCHRPHENARITLGARTVLCTGCHEDYAGPWIYEHAPVAEDCAYCHGPHGTSAYNLLETNEPGVCISCHTVAESGATHKPSAWVTRCTDCHGAIHGSFTDAHLRR